MKDHHFLFREYLRLDRRRKAEGLTPAEREHWASLRDRLEQRFSKGRRGASSRRESVRVPTRIQVAFPDEHGVSEALMTNLSRGGLFISTRRPADLGTRFDLRLRIDRTGEVLEIPVRVVSTNVGPGLTSGRQGMGVTFLDMDADVRKRIDELYANAAEEALRESEENAAGR